jgi:geranylgeranyl reductase family protein
MRPLVRTCRVHVWLGVLSLPAGLSAVTTSAFISSIEIPARDFNLARACAPHCLSDGVDVPARGVHAEQNRAGLDRLLQRRGAFVGNARVFEDGRDAAGNMTGRFAEPRRERTRCDNRPDPWHHERDRGEHLAAKLAEYCGRPRVLDVSARRSVHLFRERAFFIVAARDDRNPIAPDAHAVKDAGGGGRRRGGFENGEHKRMRHWGYVTRSRFAVRLPSGLGLRASGLGPRASGLGLRAQRLRPERGAKPPSESERGGDPRALRRHVRETRKLTNLRTDFDVAVVGAGPAGSWTAFRLAKAGARVALIDGSHPREKPCGGGVTGRAFALVEGALSAALPIVSVDTATFSAAGRRAVVDMPLPARSAGGLGIVSRREFDGALLAAATEAGAHHLAHRVTALEQIARGWNIVAGDTRVSCAWLVGADGANSFVRRHVSTPFPRGELSVATGYFVRGHSTTEAAVDFDDSPTGYLWSFPRADHLAVGACGQADAASSPALLTRARRWIDAHVAPHGTLDRYSWPIPSLSEPALAAERPAGDRWLLVGDAAGLVDPITREGIYFALLSGEHAGRTLQMGSTAAEYTRRLRETVFDELHRAAHLKSRFFRPEMLALLVRALERSKGVRTIMADLISGNQTYAGLRRRLIGTLELRLMFELFRL